MKPTSSATLLLAVAVALAGGLSAQRPTWKLEFLGAAPASWSGVWAVAVNDAGQVAGNTYVSSAKRAWIASPSQAPQLLPLPPGATWAQAYDMNSAGVVVGSVLIGGATSRAVLWQLGSEGYEASLLPASSGGFDPFDARGINDAGEVVGKLGILGGSYHWTEATGVTRIPTSTFPKVPYDINEQRQIIAGTYRMDLDNLVLGDLGSPTGTTFRYMFTELSVINDAGECGGYAVVATSQPPYVPVRYTDVGQWKLFNSFPWTSANVMGLSASGDTVFQLGTVYGLWVYVDGFGSISLQNTLAPAYADWDLTNSFVPAISRGGRLACTGANATTSEAGIVLLTPLAFDDLGGAAAGALGDPVLSGFGSLSAGAPTRVRLASAALDSVAGLILSATSNPVPLFGGVFHTFPAGAVIPLATDALGRFDLKFGWPSVPAGTTLYLQAATADAEATFGVSLSNALRAVTQ